MLDFMLTGAHRVRKWRFIHFQIQGQEALSPVMLVQVDVTQNLQADQALLKKFNLIGPPAILFFGPDQRERESYRVIGYMEAEKFLIQLDKFYDKEAECNNLANCPYT